MVYLLETEINKHKPLHVALTYVYGINFYLSNKICRLLGLNKNLKITNLSKDQINSLSLIIKLLKLKINQDLKKLNYDNNYKFISIKNYKGFRKLNRLPVRGQRTHTNSKTCKKSSVKL